MGSRASVTQPTHKLMQLLHKSKVTATQPLVLALDADDQLRGHRSDVVIKLIKLCLPDAAETNLAVLVQYHTQKGLDVASPEPKTVLWQQVSG